MIIIFQNVVHSAGTIDLYTGIGVDYRYFSRIDNETYQSTQQINRLYFMGEFKRDLYFGRLGDIYLKFDLSKYQLNYAEDKYFSPGIPFLVEDGKNEDYFLHNIKSKISLKIPKLDIKMLLEYDEKTEFSVDEKNFKKIGKITDDIKDLKGTIKSLNDRDWERSQNYFISRDDKVSFMLNYNKYEYYKKFETSNYMKLEDVFKYGIDISKIVGFFVEKNKKEFQLYDKNESNNRYKLGFVDYFGQETTYKLNNFRFKGYYLLTENQYKGDIFNNKYATLTSMYDIDKNRMLTLEYVYGYQIDKYTKELEKQNKIKLNYQYRSDEYLYYVAYQNIISKNIYENIDNSSYTYDEANIVLSGNVSGPGKLIIKSSGINYLTLNLTIDNSNFNQNITVFTGAG
ncbi:MAG: hypothetical protein LDL13_07300 [Calditerrivibrio sp.]|nr:hypothetical protein [Calditerrivibrio sp.]